MSKQKSPYYITIEKTKYSAVDHQWAWWVHEMDGDEPDIDTDGCLTNGYGFSQEDVITKAKLALREEDPDAIPLPPKERRDHRLIPEVMRRHDA